MKAPRCKAIVKAAWCREEAPCKLPAWADGYCRHHHPSKPVKLVCVAGTCPKCRPLALENARLLSALNRAVHLLASSAEPFDKACMIIRAAIKPLEKAGESEKGVAIERGA